MTTLQYDWKEDYHIAGSRPISDPVEPHDLWDMFRWDSTPQGREYWCDRADGRIPMSDEDWSYAIRVYLIGKYNREVSS